MPTEEPAASLKLAPVILVRTVTGYDTNWRSWRPTLSAIHALTTDSNTTQNSSPPMRATGSAWRIERVGQRATFFRMGSPSGWPIIEERSIR